MRFRNREEAGEKLATALQKYKDTDAVVYAMPRGGVPLGEIAARRLNLPLDLVIVRKVAHPNDPEFAICAVAESGKKLCNEDAAYLDQAALDLLIKDQVAEAERRREVYLRGRRRISPEGKTAIIIDDGVATGLTMKLAIETIAAARPKKIIAAAPIVPKDAYREISKSVDEFVVLEVPQAYLGAVGSYYDEFHQLEDSEVTKLLKKHNDNI